MAVHCLFLQLTSATDCEVKIEKKKKKPPPAFINHRHRSCNDALDVDKLAIWRRFSCLWFHWLQTRVADMQKSNLEDVISIVVPVIFGIVFVIGLIGNSLVVAVVSSNQQVNSLSVLIQRAIG